MWYAWSIYLQPEFTELHPRSSLKLLQFHSKPDDVYPDQHFSFEAKDGSYTPSNNINKEKGLSLSKTDMIGRWNDILMHVNWSYKNDGYYKIWANGDLIYDYSGKTLWDKTLEQILNLEFIETGWNIHGKRALMVALRLFILMRLEQAKLKMRLTQTLVSQVSKNISTKKVRWNFLMKKLNLLKNRFQN